MCVYVFIWTSHHCLLAKACRWRASGKRPLRDLGRFVDQWRMVGLAQNLLVHPSVLGPFEITTGRPLATPSEPRGQGVSQLKCCEFSISQGKKMYVEKWIIAGIV